MVLRQQEGISAEGNLVLSTKLVTQIGHHKELNS